MMYGRSTMLTRGHDVKRYSRAGGRVIGPVGVRGFTLIELMIVVGIVAILVAIAYPMYGDAVRKGKRGQAKADLVELAQRAERFRTVNDTYVGFWATITSDPFLSSPKPGQGSEAYRISPGNITATTFTLTAAPQGGQTADTRCMSLSLNQAGQKSETGSGTTADCW